MTHTESATFDHVNVPFIAHREPAVSVAVVLLTIAFVLVVAALAAGAAGKLARLDGATYPTALKHAAITFTAVLTLAAAMTAALGELFT
ncbi:hypothetical protein ACFV3E_41800 [Streptomyces sp. NPDC059718]